MAEPIIAEAEEELRQLRAELAETESGVADEGKSSECVGVDDRVAGIRQRIAVLTGTQPDEAIAGAVRVR